jgi:hypothetical protein
MKNKKIEIEDPAEHKKTSKIRECKNYFYQKLKED